MAYRGESRSHQSPFTRAILRVDAYFLSDALRNQSANDVANTRMGLLICLCVSAGILFTLPLQFSSWPRPIALATTFVAIATFVLPFAIRKTRAIRFLGQIVCGILALECIAILWLSGGQAVSILPILPMLPVAGLLVRGGRGALVWAVVALAMAFLGLGLTLDDAEPVSGYYGSTANARYAVTIICIVAMGAIAQLFERLWNRTAIEVADRAQAELLVREERNRSLLEYAKEGVLIVDAEAIIRFASPIAEQLAGIPAGGAVGHRLKDLTDPGDFLKTRHVFDDVMTDPHGVGHLQLRTRPGLGLGDPADARVLDISVSNGLDNPAVRGVVVRMRDITDLVRAEANYEALVENSLQGIAVICEGVVVYANQALAEVFGTSREELIRLGDVDNLEFVHERDRENVRFSFENSAPDTPGESEMRILRGDGEGWRWLQLRWAGASWQGRPARQIAYADITAQKELAARQERENERLEAAIAERTRELEASQQSLREQERMAAVGTLAAGIAHQINNPIGAILASADFAILTAHEENGAEIGSSALEDIKAQAIRCGKIVRSVLQFSRSEATEKWVSDLTSVIRTAVDVTARYAAERGAKFVVSLSREASERSTLMNPIELEQVFINLIRNAIESQPSGATVHVSTRLIGEEIEIVIEDDGPGIPEIHANHVFDPFYTTRLREGGTGLGLSVAHGIIEDHGGSMWLAHTANTSSPDSASGARFHIRLPAEKAHTRA